MMATVNPTTNKDIGFKRSNVGFRDQTDDTVEETKDDLMDIAQDAGKSVRRFFSERTHDLEDARDYVTTTVRKKPIQSSLIALGAGFLLGMLIRR